MLYIKQRISAFFIVLLGTFLLWHSHYDVQHTGSYSLKEAAFAPVMIASGGFLLFFPQYFGKPETFRQKAVVLGIFAVGMLFGLYNWYLIDPYSFRFLNYLGK